MSNQIASTIQAQLGRRALYMLGAKNLIAHEDGLSFRIRGSHKVNYVKVTLTPMDLYDIEYGYVRGTRYTVKAQESGVYCDMLHESIERNTGLYTSL